MKILYVCQYFPPEMGAPAARASELARAWAREGHEVTILTGLPNHPTGVVPVRYRGHLMLRERCDGYQVIRAWLYATPNKGFFRRVMNFVSFLVSAVLVGAVAAPRPDVVIGTTPQLLVGLAARVLAWVKRAPFVLEVRDLWPQTVVDLGAIRNRFLIRQLEGLETYLYRSAGLVVVVSDEFVSHILSRGVPGERIVLVPNGVDFEAATKIGALPAEAERREGALTVSYVGTHGMCQGLATIIDVGEQFRDDPSVRFLFVGEGAEKVEVMGRAAAKGLSNCTFLDAVPREVVNAIYAASDVCLVPLIDRPVFKTVLPSKIFEIMAAGRPVLISVGGRAEQLVLAADGGVAVPPGDVTGIAAAIERLRDEGLRRRLGENGRTFVGREYDRGMLAGRYAAALVGVARR